MDDEEHQLSPRQLARRKVRQDGERSTRAAHTLMSMTEAAMRRLELDPRLRQAFLAAQTITAPGARRREERRLAGVLRREDLDELEELLSRQADSDHADARLFQRAEAWRSRLITEGAPALEEFHLQLPGQDRRTMDRMVHEARRENAQGKPKGARKALFRQIADALKAPAAPAADPEREP